MTTEWKLDGEHPVVARLVALQGAMSDDAFARQHLTCSGSSWGRIKGGKYHAGDNTAMLGKLEKDLAAMEDATEAAGPGGISDEILPLRIISLGMRAVKKAWGEFRDRLVVVLAPTGGGKTTLARFVKQVYGDRVVICEASETWRGSYIAALHGVLAAAGEKSLPLSARLSEAKLIETLTGRGRIIVIDEAHYFGPATINLVKLILNRTSCTVLLLAIPQLWDRMSRTAWEEAKQIRSRTCDILKQESVAEADVAAYFDHHLNGQWSGLAAEDRRVITNRVATAARQFGQLNTVARIAREMRGEARVTRDEIDAAVKAVKLLQA